MKQWLKGIRIIKLGKKQQRACLIVLVQNHRFIKSNGEDYGKDFDLQDKKFLNPNQVAIKDTSLFTHTVVIFYDNLKKEGTCLCLNHAC